MREIERMRGRERMRERERIRQRETYGMKILVKKLILNSIL
jgi:hypothetical protein